MITYSLNKLPKGAYTVIYFSAGFTKDSRPRETIYLEKTEFLSIMLWIPSMGTWVCTSIFRRILLGSMDEKMALS